MIIVLETNVLVSALLSPHGPPGRVLDLVLAGELILAFDDRIMGEYDAVLRRPKFGFAHNAVAELFEYLEHTGLSVTASPLAVELPDDGDRPLLEVATAASAILVAGNIRHVPEEYGFHVVVTTPAALIGQILSSE